ncbi:pilus assembly protein TadG-related protein [Janthinobacterium fluminis]|uniref:Pilus assembly protein TadG-related protein n=1 Tax=Janthinobacterium fluminis TaxID=2987524 RepID=A0ABT5K9K6_9BURK|nr:pilus assembly protein TadG-related protein [Janthinobacterium fluminis]MDC8760497.1 pilus assembly protein TadG-related protein [Janthinobacterium fluminis]
MHLSPGRSPRPRRRQRGVFTVLLAPLLFVLLLCMGAVLDIAQVYNRRTEMQNVADAVALAAARELVGTAAGIDAAVAKAAALAGANYYRYSKVAVGWSEAALRFAATPDGAGGWLDYAAALAAPQNLWFVRVDTSVLAAANVDAGFMRSVNAGLVGFGAGARAVAGRTAIKLAPLAVCAMSPAAAADQARGGLVERVEYGFRRGVGYNLLALNPGGAQAESFLVNPVDLPGAALDPGHFAAAVLNPFMCSGTLPLTRQPASVYVSRVAPAAFAFSNQLNSRFGVYTGASPCDAAVAPADLNVREFLPTLTNWWGSTAALPSGQTAAATAAGVAPLRTKADLLLPSAETITAMSFGPLWAYGPAAPGGGQAAFTTANWATLYQKNSGAAVVAASGYPPAPYTPASRPGGSFFTAPAVNVPALSGRRLLHVALLGCPVPAGATATAAVLAVGRFYMTAKASAAAVSGEFAGIAGEAALGGPVGLFQ